MTPPPSLFHSLLRPAVLQILRAAGYHGAKTSVLDSMTDLAARYLYHLCELTAAYTAHNAEEDMIPTVVDVRMALQHAGALLPERPQCEQDFFGEDTRGVDEFLAWAGGSLNKEIKRIALDGEDEASDYLNGKYYLTAVFYVYLSLTYTQQPSRRSIARTTTTQSMSARFWENPLSTETSRSKAASTPASSTGSRA